MASLRSSNGSAVIYLMAHHSFGRMAHSVNTVINAPAVSRIHAIIDWSGDCWKLLDLSRNGCWLNGQKIEKDIRHELAVGDRISFGESSGESYTLVDVESPHDFLMPVDVEEHTSVTAKPLDIYNLLPDETQPEVVLYLDTSAGCWFLEPVESNSFEAREVREGELIPYAGQRWQLFYNRPEEQTQALAVPPRELSETVFSYQLSLDEESTQLTLFTDSGLTELGIRSHHYLTLTLARIKAADIAKQVDETEQGWIYTELLAKDLGLAETHINIQIHRARKQVMDVLKSDADSFIQRRSGKIRLGANVFRVMKGGELDCCSPGAEGLALE